MLLATASGLMLQERLAVEFQALPALQVIALKDDLMITVIAKGALFVIHS